MDLIAEEEWKPTRYEYERAFDAGICGWRQSKDGKTVCRHGVWQWDSCADCTRAILEFERKAGRNPLDPMQERKDRFDECEAELKKARQLLAKLEGRRSTWAIFICRN